MVQKVSAHCGLIPRANFKSSMDKLWRITNPGPTSFVLNMPSPPQQHIFIPPPTRSTENLQLSWKATTEPVLAYRTSLHLAPARSEPKAQRQKLKQLCRGTKQDWAQHPQTNRHIGSLKTSPQHKINENEQTGMRCKLVLSVLNRPKPLR